MNPQTWDRFVEADHMDTNVTKYRKPRQRKPMHLDYAVQPEEITRCSICGSVGEFDKLGRWTNVKPRLKQAGEGYPFAGLIGECNRCHLAGHPRRAGTTYYNPSWGCHTVWSPAEWVQPIDGQPIYLILRKCCDERRLASAIRETWQRIPEEARSAICNFCKKKQKRSWDRFEMPSERERLAICEGPVRIEALSNWPGAGRCLGECMAEGHALRVRTRFVDSAPAEVLSHVVAHELGHTFQYATDVLRGRTKEVIEKDVVEIIDGWGFKHRVFRKWSHEESMRRLVAVAERDLKKLTRQKDESVHRAGVIPR